ncbi:hypothetical protein C2845_PM01G25750 [Panicum miliaceum]|uniref:Uncharacterized protein n=1 Tax=Panicum miliaceum TaxID=4540 RepID=A0A3L6TSS5_PANMI|nr:hypothetical protein C2845_PM01G25750 [Panicum miliaceum]
MADSSDNSEDDITTIFNDPIAEQIGNAIDDRVAATIDAQIEAQLLGTSRRRRHRRPLIFAANYFVFYHGIRLTWSMLFTNHFYGIYAICHVI